MNAIQSTDRKATATVDALQHKIGVLLQDMEGRLSEADKEVAQRVVAAEANAQNLSRSVGEMVPTDQVSQLEAQAKANAAKTQVRATAWEAVAWCTCVCVPALGYGCSRQEHLALCCCVVAWAAGAGATTERAHGQHRRRAAE